MSDKLVHKLKKPMRIATSRFGERQYMLPAGTTLYFDASMPEGFTRYYVYVNVDGAPLDLEPTEKPGLIDPISGFFEEEPKSEKKT